MNKYLKEIGTMVGLKFPLTTYVARHTYATVLKNSGVPISKISEGLLQSRMTSINAYLKAHGDDELDEMNEKYL